VKEAKPNIYRPTRTRNTLAAGNAAFINAKCHVIGAAAQCWRDEHFAVAATAAGVSWLRSARTLRGELVDVQLAGGQIARVIPAAGIRLPGDEDLSGQVLLPSFAEPHAHLDKALTASRAPNPAGDLPGAIEAMQGIAGTLTHADIAARAERALRIHLALGTTAVRTHVNVGGAMGMRALAAMVEVRERWQGLVDVQLVALVSNPMAGQAGKDLRQALREGADVAGGCPHLDPDPDGAVGVCLDAAGEAGLPVDLHTDETLNPRMLTLATMADLVTRTGFPHQVTASHCVSLGVQPAKVQQRTAEAAAAAGIAVVALPQTNLYLQGRGHPTATPRGLTAVSALRAAGVTVAAGGDNLRDPFHPVGRGDALEVAALMVTCGHLDPAAALGSVTAAPRAALGLPTARIAPGYPADLVATPAGDALEALGAASAQRTVWRAGLVVARTTVHSEVSPPRQPTPPELEGAAP
jgi:cytosine deaminase